jgi:tagaturonate reductase
MAALPRLSRALIADPGFRERSRAALPEVAALELPEKAVQFGTGAFLRAFVECFIDEANRRGTFGGRVVLVGSTESGRERLLNEQDGLFTLVTQGLDRGIAHDERRVVSSVSRAISARDEWEDVLACARNPLLELVFSNTTEIGISLDPGDEPSLLPPRSFPGKLTRFLYERARAFDYDAQKGVVVLPCELIEENGAHLREIVLTLADRWHLDVRFSQWIDRSVPFCNTLVDRIVPGTPGVNDLDRLESELGYRDTALTTCEAYRLFAIEADASVRAHLRFAEGASDMALTGNVTPYRERKVRVLNGGHTAVVSVALLAGCETVLDAMHHELVGPFLRRAVLDEIVPSLDVTGAASFAREVLDRFANASIRHALFDITLQGTTKMKVRVVPSIVRYAEKTGQVPAALALGFAAHLLFLRGDLQTARRRAALPVPPDESGERIRRLWERNRDSDDTLDELVRTVCSDRMLWDTDLTRMPGFADAVTTHLVRAVRGGIDAALEAHLAITPTS